MGRSFLWLLMKRSEFVGQAARSDIGTQLGSAKDMVELNRKAGLLRRKQLQVDLAASQGFREATDLALRKFLLRRLKSRGSNFS